MEERRERERERERDRAECGCVRQGLGCGKNCVPAMKELRGAGYKEEGSRNAAAVAPALPLPPVVAAVAVEVLAAPVMRFSC